MTRPVITAVTRTAEGARLELDTGEVLNVAPTDQAILTGTAPFVLMLGQPMSRMLDVPAALFEQLAQAMDLPPHAAQSPAAQAALVALGVAGPYPVPDGVSLNGFRHGDTFSEAQALELAALPEYPEHWAICPGEGGGAPFTLLWADAATADEFERSTEWALSVVAALHAMDTPRGQA